MKPRIDEGSSTNLPHGNAVGESKDEGGRREAPTNSVSISGGKSRRRRSAEKKRRDPGETVSSSRSMVQAHLPSTVESVMADKHPGCLRLRGDKVVEMLK